MSEVGSSIGKVQWNSHLETYFKEAAEKCNAYAWLHKTSEQVFSKKVVWIDIPTILLSTVNGAASIGSQSLFGNTQYASVAVGLVALLCSILGTISSYFSWGRRAEAHRIANLHFSRIARHITLQLSLPCCERATAAELLAYIKAEYDKLSESSPLIDKHIIELFKQRFNGPQYERIARPDETNGLHEVVVNTDRDTQIFSRNSSVSLEQGARA